MDSPQHHPLAPGNPQPWLPPGGEEGLDWEREEEPEVDCGLGFNGCKPWIGTLQNASPTDWTAEKQARSMEVPGYELKLRHVYGYKALRTVNNCKFVDDDTLVYFAAAVGVVHDVADNKQYFYPPDLETTDERRRLQEVTSLAYHEPTRLVGTGTLGAHGSAEVCLWHIDEVARTTVPLTVLRGGLANQVTSVSIHDSGRLVAVSAADEARGHYPVQIWQDTASKEGWMPVWSEAREAPQRQRVNHLQWVPTGFPGCQSGLYFVTAQKNGVNLWKCTPQVPRGGDRPKFPVKGVLKPPQKTDVMAQFGTETFNAIAFTRNTVAAASISGIVYMFAIDLAAAANPGDGRYTFFVVSFIRAGLPAVIPGDGVITDYPPTNIAAIHAAKPKYVRDLWEQAVLEHTNKKVLDLVLELNTCVKYMAADGAPEMITEAQESLANFLKHRPALLISVEASKREGIKHEQEGVWRKLTAFARKKTRRDDAMFDRDRRERELEVRRDRLRVLKAVHSEIDDLLAIAVQWWGHIVADLEDTRSKCVAQKLDRDKADPIIQSWISRLRVDVRYPQAKILSKAAWVECKKQWERQKLRLDQWEQCAERIAKENHDDPDEYEERPKPPPVDLSPCLTLCSYGLPDMPRRFLVCGMKSGVVRVFDTEGSRDAVPMIKMVWELDINMGDPSTNNTSGGTSNAVRSVDVNSAKDLLLVGTVTASVYTIAADFTFSKSQTRPPRVNVEVEGHHGDLLANLRKRNPQPMGYGEIWSASPHPRHPLVASVTEDRSLRVWDTIHCERIKRRRLGAGGWVCTYSNDGHLIAVGFTNGAFAIYDSNTLRRMWPAPEDPLNTARYRKWCVVDIKFCPSDELIGVASFCFLDVYRVSVTAPGKSCTVGYLGTCQGNSGAVLHFDWSYNSLFMQITNRSYELLFFDLGAKDPGSFRFLQFTRSRSLRDERWATHTCTIGWNVQGIWSDGAMDGTDINSCGRLHLPNSLDRDRLLAAGNDMETLRVYRYPCVGGAWDAWGRKKDSGPGFREYLGHGSHVCSVSFSTVGQLSQPQHGDSLMDRYFLFTTGGRDLCIFQWELVRQGGRPMVPGEAPSPVKSAKKGRHFTEMAWEQKPEPSRTDSGDVDVADVVAGITVTLREYPKRAPGQAQQALLRYVGRLRGMKEWDTAQHMFKVKHADIVGGSLIRALTMAFGRKGVQAMQDLVASIGGAWKAPTDLGPEMLGVKIFDKIDLRGDGVITEGMVAGYLNSHPELRSRLRAGWEDFRRRFRDGSSEQVSRKDFRQAWAACRVVARVRREGDEEARRPSGARGRRNTRRQSERKRSLSGMKFSATAPPGGAAPGAPPEPMRPHTKAWLRQNRESVASRTTVAATARRVTTLRSQREVQRARMEAEEYEDADMAAAGTYRPSPFASKSPLGPNTPESRGAMLDDSDSQFAGDVTALQAAIRAVQAAKAERKKAKGGLVNTV
eukprot:Hpha_TRINITY_DN3129_c0_g1::TRINITY_DN3129_c0_g1_i1::g.96609::m.96609/K18598/EML6; echinoderm microtubule-associated protein-like 6